jgi:hypothetical protein
MYLVQLSFLSSAGGLRFPNGIREMMYAVARFEDGLEHVSVVERSDADPVIGLFLRAPCLERAERTAVLLWFRAVEHHPGLAAHQLFRAEMPLIDDGGEWPGEEV